METTRKLTDPLSGKVAVIVHTPDVIGDVNAVSAFPEAPVIDSAVDSNPSLADHVTRAPPTALPKRS